MATALSALICLLPAEAHLSSYGLSSTRNFKGYQLDKPGEHYGLCSRPANTNAHMSNLLLLMAQRMGVETDRFGDSNKAVEL